MKPQFLLPLLLWFLLPACGDDDYRYPDVLTQFVDLQTDASGRALRLITDEGTPWTIQPREGLDNLVPDTLYRTVTMYAPAETTEAAGRSVSGDDASVDVPSASDGNAMARSISAHASSPERQAIVYRVQLIHAPRPRPASQFKTLHTDPVSLQSLWHSGNYLNLILQVKVKDQPHAYHFIEDALETNADGTHTLRLTLYHDRAGDPEAYSQRTYLSVPLHFYADTLRPGDEIVFTLHTYEEGGVTRRFTY